MDDPLVQGTQSMAPVPTTPKANGFYRKNVNHFFTSRIEKISDNWLVRRWNFNYLRTQLAALV
jgi:hypothetical protein